MNKLLSMSVISLTAVALLAGCSKKEDTKAKQQAQPVAPQKTQLDAEREQAKREAKERVENARREAAELNQQRKEERQARQEQARQSIEERIKSSQ